MKEKIIKTLNNAIEFTDKEFESGKHSHAYLIGYLQGVIKTTIEELENLDLKNKK